MPNSEESSTSSSSTTRLIKRARSTDSDDSIVSKKSRLTPHNMEGNDLEPYVRKRRSSIEKARLKSRLESLDPDEQDRVRQTINSRERKRMHNLNFALDDLRDSLPTSHGAATRKLSKINTIVCATDWIRTLQKYVDVLRQKLVDTGADVPQPPIFNASFDTAISPVITEKSNPILKTIQNIQSQSNVSPLPKPPLDPIPAPPIPMFTPNVFTANIPHFFLQHQAAAAAAAAAAVHFQTFQNLHAMPAIMPPNLPSVCIKHLKKGVCFCSSCIVNKCGKLPCNN